MLKVQELRSLLSQIVQPLPAVHADLSNALDLVLAESVLVTEDDPPFDRSAMDGYAVREDAKAGLFQISAETPPGVPASEPPAEGEALRVLTGSALPQGVRVIPQEKTIPGEDQVMIPSIAGPSHVRKRGSALRAGDCLLAAGTQLSPTAIAALASAGKVTPIVHRPPSVAHLTTGREIVPPETQPGPGEIRNSNGPLLRALLTQSGAHLVNQSHVLEDLDSAWEHCRNEGLDEADVLLISGGASVGPHDHSGELLQRLGYELVCQSVNCRPGKPLLVGVRGSQIAFGLPGNPVSHFVTFHLFVKPVLLRLRGAAWPEFQKTTLQSGQIQSDSRETYWPAQRTEQGAHALPWLDSGHLAALLPVNALLRIPPETLPQPGALLEMLPCS